MTKQSKVKGASPLSKATGRALKRAALRARQTARRFGTPIHVVRNGKVVAIRP